MDALLTSQIRNRCAELDIPLVGFAPAARWDDQRYESLVPLEFRPGAIFPGTKTVIVIGIPVFLPIVETTPSIWYHELYKTVNTLLDTNGYRISTFLFEEGHTSVWIPRDGYGTVSILKEKPLAFFSHRHAAYLAGLGTFGVNNMILTRKYGPRVRFTSIFTTAELTADEVIEEGLCIRCMRCVYACPEQVLDEQGYPLGITNKKDCATRSETLSHRFISPCGICIKVCPVGEDRIHFNREDMHIYDENNPSYHDLHHAWNHVRSYGGGEE